MSSVSIRVKDFPRVVNVFFCFMEAEKHTANNLLTEYKTEDSSAEREKKSYYFEVAKLI